MARKVLPASAPIPDPRATESAEHLGMALYPQDAAAFAALVEASGLTRSGWVRGAIRAATADPTIAQAIAEAGDRTGHGGQRPGAGRPKRVEVSEADGRVDS